MSIKKMVVLLGILFSFYVILSFLFRKDGICHEVDYKITKENVSFDVKEKLTYHESGERDHYSFEITVDHNSFFFQLFDPNHKKNYIIQDIDYYKGKEYTCIFPHFKTEEVYQPLLCRKEGIVYPYHTMKGKSEEVDSLAQTLAYDFTPYNEDKSDVLKKGTLTIYRKNLLANHYIAVENYKGISLINQKDVYKDITLFKKDIYMKNMAIFGDDFYLVADYNQKYTFNELFKIDIKNGKESAIISNAALNLDGYFMGKVEDNIYFFDKSRKEQYSISLKNEQIRKNGNQDTGIQIYEDGIWKDVSNYAAYQTKLTFYEEKMAEDKYAEFARVDKVGTDKSGSYYFYKKVGNVYHVYQAPILDDTKRTYLFDTTSIDQIIYQKDFIYYLYDKEIRYYSHLTGVKTVLSNTEFTYNKTLKFGAFIS